MHNRIREVRKALHMTQADFGAKIGVRGNTVTGYENGQRVPSDAVIVSICREFHVDEHWLRTGDGKMFTATTRDEEIMDFVGRATIGEGDVSFWRLPVFRKSAGPTSRTLPGRSPQKTRKRSRIDFLLLFLCFSVFLYAARSSASVSRSFCSLASSSKRSISRRKYARHSSSVISHPPTASPQSFRAPGRS